MQAPCDDFLFTVLIVLDQIEKYIYCEKQKNIGCTQIDSAQEDYNKVESIKSKIEIDVIFLCIYVRA